ncbi:lipase chaperone [Mycobacterium sp. UM_CSW]|uniref:lipase chaperone n=1 Tax=Mycobacterium sp. UM_CSW TaxID=1370119 RepID=UPI00082C5905|nr:lipase chaperone [Mycobacterium sp. UM_CSW]
MATLVAGTLAASSPARADEPVQPAPGHTYPLRPPPAQGDPFAEADELRRQIADLDASWESLTPAERNQRIAGLQQQVTKVDLDSRNLPQDQKAGVDAILLPSLVHLADLLRKVQTPPTSPCIFPACLPGL